VARIKFAYLGGGSTRAPGTVASLIEQGENFQGSEVVLIDLNAERLQLVKTIATKMALNKGLDLTITATTDRRAGLADADAVLSSFRPGGFEARYLDESIPLKHGVIGQETQGPGGFFMALRSINVMQGVMKDIEAAAPRAVLLNYTNPVNIVSEAITHHSPIPCISLCEGSLHAAADVASAAGLDRTRVDATVVGLNHGSWSVRASYDGQNFLPLVHEAWERRKNDPALTGVSRRLFELAVAMDAVPNHYFQYYYYKDEILAELQAKPTTRSQDIMASVPDYWSHYREQAASDVPVLNPARSRGGIMELELAIDVLDAIFNDRKEVWAVNIPNKGALADFPDDMVVEGPGFVDRSGAHLVAQGHLPRQVTGLVKMLGEYQALAAEAAWSGTRIDGIRALATNPLVPSLRVATELYDEMAAAHNNYLPARLLA
jgi:6-phospho-beta-glucosidase